MLELKKDTLALLITLICAVPVAYPNPHNYSDFFPLQIGNKWEYKVQYSLHSEELVDTLRVNGILYYGLASGSPEHIENWLRNDNGVIKVLNMSDSLEFTLFDFTAQVGTSWDLPVAYECSLGNQVTLASITDTVITQADTFYNCYHFTFFSHCSDAGLYDAWYAAGIGKVRYIENSYIGIMDYKLTALQLDTGVKHSKPSVAANYRLLQNYPNPFNSATVIPYSLQRSGYVSIKLYNLLGQLILSFVNNFQNAGEHSIIFNADNIQGGIYFYRLEIDKQIIATRKLIYLK